MRATFGVALAAVVALGACGKHEDEGGPDLRKPPPVPSRTGEPKPAPPPGSSASAGNAPARSAPAPSEPPPAPAPGSPPAAPAVEVKVATPFKKTVSVTADYTGQTVGSETVEVRARVEGYLEAI